MYKDLPTHMTKIFEHTEPCRVTDLNDIDIENLLQNIFTTTPIHTKKKLQDGTPITVCKFRYVFNAIFNLPIK